MDHPDELLYSKEHLWIRVEGSKAVIGITDYAQEKLGSISAIELPDAGDDLDQDDSFGSVEARKTVADLYAPVSGQVVEVNGEIADSPEIINDDPYDGGWLLVVEMSDPEELKLLMSVDDYLEQTEVEEE
ncbi:MAG: glycine cleavage system protein GcvH [Geobacter sp.]|nr:glycine cleavage system protein GcvH [Geobacter sp.]